MSVSYSPNHIEPDHYFKFVESVAFRTHLNPTAVFDRDDALGSGLEALWKALSRYDAAKGASLRTYAWRQVMWGMIGEYRKQFPFRQARYNHDDAPIKFIPLDIPLSEDSVGEELMYQDIIPDTNWPDPDKTIDVRDAMNQLSPRQKEVIQGVYWEGKTHAEMGKIMGCGTATCSRYTKRALRKLRIIMDGGRPHPYVQHGRRRKIPS